MRMIIIEDEKPAARLLQRKLENMAIKVECMLHSVEASLRWFKENPHPDLIFLDIQLSDGLSFEIFEEIEITSAVIFTTAYDDYALKAFKLNSIDYLLKPIDDQELQVAFEKFKMRIPSKEQVVLDFNQIKQFLVNPLERSYRKRFTTRIGQHLKMISVEEIECFYSENKGTYAFTLEGRNYLLENTLEDLDQELAPEVFFRISRKFYVNINAIKDIVSYTNSRLEIKLHTYNELPIIVSRERVKAFRDWLNTH